MVDEETLEFLKRLREKVRAPERVFRPPGRFEGGFEGARRNVYTGYVERELGMEHSECEARLAELVRAGCLHEHPDPSLTRQGVYRITDEGIAKADEG
jgi:hypothetical protein